MTTFDFTPLFRSTVGFDRLMNLMETSARWAEAENGYPPYDIEKTGQDRYRITVAVAGFDEKELSAEVRENVLFIEGRKREPETGHTYLYRGIAGRSFKRQFQLADYVQVVSASVQNGLLIVELVRELPEAMKPRKIEIVGSSSRDDRKPEDSQLIEGSPEAA